MAKQPKSKASTQEHLDIEDIVDDLVVLKTGWVALVMSTTAVNFDLLSEAEQDATIYAYGAFLNSLTFPLQTLIRSKKADITAYFNSLEEAERTQPNPDLKNQIAKYKDFIQATVQQKTVLDKKFYLIINYSTTTAGFGFGKKVPTFNSRAQLVETAKVALAPRRDHVIHQTARLGLLTRQLTTQELVELFYDIYNPAPAGTQRVILDSNSYTTPLVQPAIETPGAQMADVGPQIASHNPMIVNPVEEQRAKSVPEANLRPVPNQLPPTPPPLPASTPQVFESQPAPGAVEGQVAQPAFTPPMSMPVPAMSVQAQALKNLQEAASRASQFVNQAQPTVASQSVNPVAPSVQGGVK